jgi:hypothetical protein
MDPISLEELLENRLKLNTTLNLLDFKKREHKVFPPRTNDVLKDFHVYRATYKTIWPVGCTQDLKDAAIVRREKIYQDLQVFLILPKSLHEAKESRNVRVAVDFYGGGGVRI